MPWWEDCSPGTYCYNQPADRCAARANRPFKGFAGIFGTVFGDFENKCKVTPSELGMVFCLVRYVNSAGAGIGVTKDCATDQRFLFPYLKSTIGYPCEYSATTYYWRVEGFGWVTLLNGQYYSSDASLSAVYPMKCL